METRIRKRANDWVVDVGIYHSGGASIGFKPGYTMPAFIVYESRTFNSEKAAKSFARNWR